MGQGGGQGELEGGGLHPKTTRLQLGAYRGSPRSGSSTQSVAGGAAAAWALLIKTFILHFIVVCTELPKACAGPGLGQRGAGGPALAPGASDVGVTQTLGRSVLRPFEVGGLKHSFFTSCPKGWTPPGGGGADWSLGPNPSQGGGKWLQREARIRPPPPRQRGAGAQCAWCCRAGGAGATKGGGRAPCHGEEGAQGRRGPQGRPPTAGVGFSAESVPGPEASGGAASAALTPSLFTRICSPRAASAPQCSWIWGVPGGIPAPGSR